VSRRTDETRRRQAATKGASISREVRINRRIRAREVRLIGAEGEQLGILGLTEAQAIADEQGLDLVEVAALAVPPVCRIMDYGKFKYDEKKRAQDARKKATQTELKEVKIRPKTGEHDFQTKLRHARDFLSEHDKVKVTVVFRGREITHPEIARKILTRFEAELQDVGVVEQPGRLEGKAMTMVFSPSGKKPAAAQPPRTGSAGPTPPPERAPGQGA